MRIRTTLALILFCFTACALPAKAYMIAARYGAHVTDSVTQTGPTTWRYDFSLTNDSYWSPFVPRYQSDVLLTQYELPFFADAGIGAIIAPTGWTYSIDSADAFNLGHGAQTLIWSATSSAYGIDGSSAGFAMGDTLSGFSYSAGFGPVEAPFTARFNDGTYSLGDPALPGSPAALAAGLNQPSAPSNVPEPSGIALMMLGLLALSTSGNRSRQSKNA